MAGTLEKPCSGNLSNAKHPVSQTLLDFTLGEVLYNPFPVNKTRITRLWKCSRRVCLCNYEVENKDFLTPYTLQHHGCPHLSNVKGSPQSNDVKCELRNAKTASPVGRRGDFVAGFWLSFPSAVNPEPLVRMAADFLLNDRGVLLRGEAEGVLPAVGRWLDGG